jgi:hypothetical protein
MTPVDGPAAALGAGNRPTGAKELFQADLRAYCSSRFDSGSGRLWPGLERTKHEGYSGGIRLMACWDAPGSALGAENRATGGSYLFQAD